MLRRALVVVALVTACGGTSSTETDAGADAAVRVPAVHRAQAAACPTDRPPSNPPPITGTCKVDVDCTQGKNGRCISVALAPATCSYDLCTTDVDCGASVGVCDCRATAEGGANLCRQGNCRIDGDCGVVGRGFCSPSAVGLSVSCRTGVPAGAFGFFCHTATDECVSDGDCPGPSAACIYDGTKTRWVCITLACTR